MGCQRSSDMVLAQIKIRQWSGSMRNIRLLMEYDGARYDGWQRLGKKSGQTTIQGKLEEVLSRMTGENVEVIGSGRTDAGVHAMGQVANFHTECGMDCHKIREYMERYLPEDIGILSVEEAPQRFHSRLNAIGKKYLYRVYVGERAGVFCRKYVHCIRRMPDLDNMRAAASSLVGRHDFIAFSSVRRTKKSTERELYSIEILPSEKEIHMIFDGNGFLHHMVRIMAGTLLEVGLGEKKPEDMVKILDSKNRQCAGVMAPAKGLFLMEVRYSGGQEKIRS